MNTTEEMEETAITDAVKYIEAIDTGYEQKAQLILVLLRLKPVAELSLYPWNTSPAETEQLLKKAGLIYLQKKNKKQAKTTAEYAVSRDYETATQLLNCESPVEYGSLMGYPPTAIAAYIDHTIYGGPLPPDIKKSIFKMAFSTTHTEEEFELIRKWDAALRQYAPNLVH